jgi:hypothetical protein
MRSPLMTLGILATVLSVSASAAFRRFLSSDPGSYESFGSQYRNLFVYREGTYPVSIGWLWILYGWHIGLWAERSQVDLWI